MLQDSPVKNQLLEMLQKEYEGYHPLLSLAEIALEKDDDGNFKTDVKVRADCHKTIARYVESELKSVEVKGNMSADFGHLRVTIIDEDDDDDEPEADESLNAGPV